MYSSFVNAFVEQIFPSGLGLFVHDKASPNTSYTDDPLQKPSTFPSAMSYNAPEILIRRKQIAPFIKRGEPHAVRVWRQYLIVPPDHVPVVVVMNSVMPAEHYGFRV